MGFKEFSELVGPQFFVLMQWVLFGLALFAGWLIKRSAGKTFAALERIPSSEKLAALDRIPSAEFFADLKATLGGTTRIADHNRLVSLVEENTKLIREHETMLHDHDNLIKNCTRMQEDQQRYFDKRCDQLQKDQDRDHERLSNNIADTDYIKAVVELRKEPRKPPTG